ncbi:MAG TPA: trypsin-like serine protease [Candidatus Binataceae bacterium]|nr:trypsin-like serine protease [Candidatus Binataceae bacterium]
MLASQAFAALGGLVVLLPVALADLPFGDGSQSAFGRGEPPGEVTHVDHRRIVDARLSPYSAIGKFSGTMICTAAIVLNPRIIITAGHCITERDGTTRRSHLSFQLGYQSGTSLGRFEATVWAIGSKQEFAGESIKEASNDWAILLLDRAPMGVHPLLLSDNSLTNLQSLERQILLPAYSIDIANAEVLSVDPDCGVRDLIWDTLIHDCMAEPGSSGAPLLMREGPEYAVIGIHTASVFARDDNGHAAKFVGNQAIGSWMFSEAARRLSRQLKAELVHDADSADY